MSDRERHPAFQAVMEEIEQIEDPGRKLRYKVRALVQHYAAHRQDNYDIFMAHWSVLWHLNGRSGLTMADRLYLVTGAMSAVSELLAHDEEDEELIEAMGYCEQLHHMITDEISAAQLLASAQRDFAEWSEELKEIPE